jgi:hypothetical protein
MSSPPVTWDGLNLNPLVPGTDGVLPVVEDVTGWHDTPDFNGNDLALVLADGSVYGPKTANARTVSISGSVIGPPAALATFRDRMARRASALVPALLTIPDQAGRPMTATVRCDSDGMKHTFAAPNLFQYVVTLTAADARLYGTSTQLTLTNTGGANTGRGYPLAYPRQYASATLPNTASLQNQGNVPAPVMITYAGDLGPSRLVDDANGNTIYFGAVLAGARIYLDSENLTAWADGGASRASLVGAGSVPLQLPPLSAATWTLYAVGAGQVTLQWSSAWQ